jgi:uncharacterized protein (TIGR02246 family)
MDATPIANLYERLLQAWNERDAAKFASLFEENGHVTGFDGSQMTGRAEIESSLKQIFTDHVTSKYVGKIREVRYLTQDVMILRAVSGMIPPNGTDINPSVNTIQAMVAKQHDDAWYIALYQNTPAQFHGRPDLAQALTDELRELIK